MFDYNSNFKPPIKAYVVQNKFLKVLKTHKKSKNLLEIFQKV